MTKKIKLRLNTKQCYYTLDEKLNYHPELIPMNYSNERICMKLNNRTFSCQQPFCSHISSTIFGPVSRNKTCKKKNIFLYNLVNQNNVIKRAFEKEIQIIRWYMAIEKNVGQFFSFLCQLKKTLFFSAQKERKRQVVSARIELATFCDFQVSL